MRADSVRQSKGIGKGEVVSAKSQGWLAMFCCHLADHYREDFWALEQGSFSTRASIVHGSSAGVHPPGCWIVQPTPASLDALPLPAASDSAPTRFGPRLVDLASTIFSSNLSTSFHICYEMLPCPKFIRLS